MPAGIGFGGKLSFDAGLAVDKGVVRVAPISVALTDLDATQGEKHFRDLKVALAASIEVNAADHSAKISGLKLDLGAPFGTGEISAESIAVTPGQSLPTLQNGKITFNADLGDVTKFASDAGLMPAGVALAGKLNFETALAVDKGVVRITPINLTVTDLDAAQGEKHLREPKVTIGGSIEANMTARSAKISAFKCEISAGSVAIESLDVPDWAKATAGVTATITADLDLERALTSFKDFAALPPSLKAVTGQAKFTLKATALADKQSVNVDAAVTSLKVTPATGPVIEEPKFSMVMAADIAPATQTVTLNSLAIQSSFYSMDAKGSLADWGKARNLTLDGTQQRNWDKIGPLVAAFSGKPVEMSGKDDEPLHVVTSLGADGMKKLLAATIFSTGLKIAKISYMGLDMTLNVSLDAKDSIATANITGKVNDGALNLPARVDASKDTPEFTLPPNTAILTDAKITPAMADQALANALPIFKGCTSTSGSISLDSKSFNAPLGADAMQKAAFEGGLSFKGVHMGTAGMLQSILAAVSLAGAGGVDVARIPDQRVTLSLRNGRIYEGPMQIALPLCTITISGSVGLADKTLDMAVEIPITPAMVGNQGDVAQALKGQVLRVAITGTTDKPQYSATDSLKQLVQNAGKKLLEQKAKEQGSNLVNQGLKNLFK